MNAIYLIRVSGLIKFLGKSTVPEDCGRFSRVSRAYALPFPLSESRILMKTYPDCFSVLLWHFRKERLFFGAYGCCRCPSRNNLKHSRFRFLLCSLPAASRYCGGRPVRVRPPYCNALPGCFGLMRGGSPAVRQSGSMRNRAYASRPNGGGSGMFSSEFVTQRGGCLSRHKPDRTGQPFRGSPHHAQPGYP